MSKQRTIAVGTTLLVLALTATFAVTTSGRQAPGVLPGVAQGSEAAERTALYEAFVSQWSTEVADAYGRDSRVWSQRLAPTFAKADLDNLREAATRQTFEAAMAAVEGLGHKLTDADVTKAAEARSAGRTVADFPSVLGSLANDLVYTPVAPCRIVDTRSTAAGAIAANSARNFLAINASNFTAQGGSATNCGTLGLSATAVALNVTAVTPSGGGFATVYPFGTTQPLAASVNYAAGAIVNNAIIAQIPNPLASFDFTVYTLSASHYVVDIVGYFAPNVATALQCVETANTDLVVAANGGTGNATAPACAVGYTQTSTNCESSSWLMPFVYFQSGTCSSRNGAATAETLRASRTCCRVPGR